LEEKLMSSSVRPSVQPWKRKNARRNIQILAASTLPIIAYAVVILLTNLDSSLAFITIFLPLQLISASLVGFNSYGKRGIGDAFLMVITFFFSAFVLVLLLSVLFSVIDHGSKALSLQFITQNNVYIAPTTSLEYGGIGHAIVGTLMIVAMTTLIAVPLGIAMSIYLTQSQSKLRGLVRTVTQALSGLPSIVSGLFILSIIQIYGLPKSAFFGALSLLPLMLPTVARVAEEALKLVPSDLRLAALALGAPNFKAFFMVILPAAKSGLITALLLGMARIVGETAPLILTVGIDNTVNFNPFGESMETLPAFIFGYLHSPFSSAQARSWGAALFLLCLVGVLF
jgi:phosphate transport system permease protein